MPKQNKSGRTGETKHTTMRLSPETKAQVEELKQHYYRTRLAMLTDTQVFEWIVRDTYLREIPGANKTPEIDF